jgi:hypothetical protein
VRGAVTDNRSKMPECAKVIDQFRAVFGEVKVLEVEEGGRVISTKASERLTKALAPHPEYQSPGKSAPPTA